ncbi:NADPH--cytochrome P450 reductase-like [Diaphorina citri]|uniref:NADPH--cytochrome P450 reductase-like n=1 Tax=Diaphorina citri TaxID=121845 RepID=A0A3Q0J586_DIACI|nr:NADPH--cytochrome P450 reductase-like [Diaphorina citri]
MGYILITSNGLSIESIGWIHDMHEAYERPALSFGVLIASIITAWYYFKKKEEDVPKRDYNISVTPMGSSTQSTETSFIKKLKASDRKLVAFYGSQTGTGEEFAGRLAKEGIRYKMKGMVADPEEYEMVSKKKLFGRGNNGDVTARAI